MRKLDAVFGPLLYSDVNEKVVGVTTVGGVLTFTLTCDGDAVDAEAATRIRNAATAKLLEAIA